jgi:Rieske Fe-S protein
MAEDEADPRRRFLKQVAAGSGAVVGVMAAVPGLGLLTHPLRHKTVTGGDEPIRVSVAPGEVRVGKPVRVDIVSDVGDGWMRLEKVKLGAAWLLRAAEGGLRAFSTVCPHLGCGIDWDPTTEKFDCPCHHSGFGADGKCLFGPAPRGLDELTVVATDAEIRIRYQRFKVASRVKEPIG